MEHRYQALTKSKAEPRRTSKGLPVVPFKMPPPKRVIDLYLEKSKRTVAMSEDARRDLLIASDAVAYPCPVCEALIGQFCNPALGPTNRFSVHKERLEFFQPRNLPPRASSPREPRIETLASDESVGEFQRNNEEIRALPFSPIKAFVAAWRYSLGTLFKVSDTPDRPLVENPRYFACAFATQLGAICVSPNRNKIKALDGHLADALDEFLKTTAILLDSWLSVYKYPEPQILWCDTYAALACEMQRAQQARILWSARPNYFKRLSMDKPTLTPMHKLRGQRTFSQVGKTAAYILWGEFLAGDPLSIGFCEVCLHPFIMTRSNKRFYPPSCGNRRSSNRAHKNDIRKENWELMKNVSRKLNHRLTRGYRGDMLKNLDVSGRWLTRFIRAAECPDDSELRERLLRLCIENGCSEDQLWEVCRVYAQFLEDILKAKS